MTEIAKRHGIELVEVDGNGHQIDRNQANSEYASSETVSLATASAAVADLAAAGYEADEAPDAEDPSQRWVYVRSRS